MSWVSRTKPILIGPVGVRYLPITNFDVGNISAAHGRTPAVATAANGAGRRHRHWLSGDGDLSAIGAAGLIHAANRGENITIIFVNNAITA